MKPILMKLGIGLASLILAAAVWYALILALRYSGVNVLQQLAFWISPLSFTGWLALLILWFLFYLWLSKLGAGLLSG